MWPSTFGLAATVVSGLALALVLPSDPSDRGRNLTWWTVMEQGQLR
jgi:hypothetical protein